MLATMPRGGADPGYLMATQVTDDDASANLRSGLKSHADQICTAPDSRPATTILMLLPSVADDIATQLILCPCARRPPGSHARAGGGKHNTHYSARARSYGNAPVQGWDGRHAVAVHGPQRHHALVLWCARRLGLTRVHDVGDGDHVALSSRRGVAHAPTEATRSCRAHGMCQRSLPYKFFMLARPELVLWQALLAHAEPALQLVQAGIRIAARATEKERTGQDVSTSPGKTQMPWSRTQA